MVKLVVIELDGTLLNDDNQIDKRTKIAVEALCERQIKVVFASGRSLSGTAAVTDKLNLGDFLDCSVCFNGAYILDKNNNILFDKSLTGKEFLELHHLVTADDLSIYAFDSEKILVTEMNSYAYEEAYKNNTSIVQQSLEEIVNETMIYKIVVAGNSDKLDELEKGISFDLKKNYSIVRSHKNKLAFLNPTVNKVEALKIMTDSMGVLLEETMAISDAVNDMEMIKSAGKGIVMENALEEVKIIADYVTTNNNSSGVAKALEMFILDKDVMNSLK